MFVFVFFSACVNFPRLWRGANGLSQLGAQELAPMPLHRGSDILEHPEIALLISRASGFLRCSSMRWLKLTRRCEKDKDKHRFFYG
ncbi:MAG: hypothetical protein V1863_02660 [Candidatus Omnitrophota bacterium]